MQAQRGGSYSSNPFAAVALEEYGWSGPCLSHFMPRKDLVSVIQEVGWSLGPVWTGMGTLISNI